MSTPQSSPAPGVPPAEIHITEGLIRSLLNSQCPEFAQLPLQAFSSGWDNVMFKLGETHLVRMPRRAVAAPLLLKEQQWLKCLQAQLTLPIPAPVYVGMPEACYPWAWSVLPFLNGEASDLKPPLAENQGVALAHFLLSLHTPAPNDAPINPVRGVPLRAREAVARERFARLKNKTPHFIAAHEALFDAALDAAIDVSPTWIHGDLHARNVLVNDVGEFCGVIDWGDLGAGDQATDLAAIWMLLPRAADRKAAINAYPATAATWARARGWAVLFGALLLDAGLVNDARLAAIGEHTLHRLQDDIFNERY